MQLHCHPNFDVNQGQYTGEEKDIEHDVCVGNKSLQHWEVNFRQDIVKYISNHVEEEEQSSKE